MNIATIEVFEVVARGANGLRAVLLHRFVSDSLAPLVRVAFADSHYTLLQGGRTGDEMFQVGRRLEDQAEGQIAAATKQHQANSQACTIPHTC